MSLGRQDPQGLRERAGGQARPSLGAAGEGAAPIGRYEDPRAEPAQPRGPRRPADALPWGWPSLACGTLTSANGVSGEDKKNSRSPSFVLLLLGSVFL